MVYTHHHAHPLLHASSWEVLVLSFYHRSLRDVHLHKGSGQHRQGLLVDTPMQGESLSCVRSTCTTCLCAQKWFFTQVTKMSKQA